MSPYDVTPDDEPLNAGAVGHDDLMIEQLRHALSPDAAVIWDDEDDELDPAFALLRALQLDVSANLPMGETLLPVGVTSLLPRRRHLSRTATVAAIAAGVLSIGGVAAASAPGQPLAGVRHAVSDAVSHAVDAITPDSPVGPAVENGPSAKPTPPGAATSAAARSASAIPQVEANLARAAAFLDAGKASQAKQQLVAAARKLALVTDADAKARLQARLTALQARLAAMPTAKPTHEPGDNHGRGNEGENGQGKGNDDGDNASDPSGKNRDTSGKGADDGTTSGKNRPDAVRTPDATETEDASSGKSGRDATKAPTKPSEDATTDSSGHSGSD